MIKDFRLGSRAETQDGQLLGELKHLVMSPDNKMVTHLVIGKGDGTPLRQVEMAKVADVTDDKDTVRLSLDEAQFEQLPEFNERAFMDKRGYHDHDELATEKAADPTDPQSLITGPYDIHTDENLNPPGLVNDQSKT